MTYFHDSCKIHYCSPWMSDQDSRMEMDNNGWSYKMTKNILNIYDRLANLEGQAKLLHLDDA